jgi:DNA repair exonuclease SbcCD ATPase subunit
MCATKTKKKIDIPNKAKIRVIWEDSPENYTKERQKRMASYFSEKYNNNNVQVIFKPKKVDIEGTEIEMTVADNVMDTEYQRRLFKEWLSINSIDVDYDRLLKLDDKVNEKLSQEREIDYRYRNWYVKELEWSNFLSFGDGNKLSFDKLEGITTIDSVPENQGGKTTLTLDLLLFLFFNTTTKGNTAIKMFNRYRDDVDEVKVKGTVNIDGIDYIIERNVVRKLKRNGVDYTTRTDLNFHRILPDGSIENLEGEQRRETDDLIKKSIGTVDDFLLTIIADADNLEDIIKAKPTEKGRTLSRFIGLEVIEDKEKICKEMKSSWSKGLKSDQYDTVTLQNEIEGFKENILTEKSSITTNEKLIEDVTKSIKDSIEIKEGFISQKAKIDNDIINLRPEDIDREIEGITSKGKKVKEKLDGLKEQFKDMEDIDYDEDKHNELIKEERTLKVEVAGYESDFKKTEKLICSLEEGEFCPTCKQALADVDHSEEIQENKNLLTELSNKTIEVGKKVTEVGDLIKEFDGIKKKADEYYKHSIMIDKIELELENMRLNLKEQNDLKKKYESNVENIEKNKDLDSKILGYSSKISNLETEKSGYERAITISEANIKNLTTNIDKHKELIETIKVEEEIKIIFDLYIRMLGKNGIVKLIMKSVMPLINSELDRLLQDVVNFKLRVNINDKNEVEFLLTNPEKGVEYPIQEGSGLEKTVSSLALRVVMSKVSCLPKPNIIVFDECFGKVANINLDFVGEFFQKCSDMFPNIFIISHNPIVKDWAKNIITVNKVDDVSSLTLQ